MYKVRLSVLALALLALGACSKSSGGDQSGNGENGGNLPLAEAGNELADINFEFDSSALSQSSQSTLRSDGRWLLDNPGRNVVVEGHCDERGTAEYNLALGERRAQSAFDFLRSLGVKEGQMKTVSYGEELPLDPGHTESSWSKNRRAHFSTK